MQMTRLISTSSMTRAGVEIGTTTSPVTSADIAQYQRDGVIKLEGAFVRSDSTIFFPLKLAGDHADKIVINP